MKVRHSNGTRKRLKLRSQAVLQSTIRRIRQGRCVRRDVSGAARTLKTFETGRNRIVAVAQRKLLARPDEPLWLTVDDFVIR